MKFDILEKWNRKMPRHTRICLISGLLIGWLTHFYMFTHKLPNWDDLNNIGAPGRGLSGQMVFEVYSSAGRKI